MRQLLIRPQARLDLLQIWHYIAADNPGAAEGVIERLESAMRGLAEMPGKGHRRSDVADVRYRFWSVFSYLIAYRYDAASLTVVRVVHGSRNVRGLFRE
ncbi:MAG TPA: type II toxin-antitoxin system RelE/ParE family toxin [Tepidisphaeraceae bacterium]|nr:type II toxin-antitoxin system RelE/ParE family toxin [Tepidisphaeraceae bacterium]